MSEIVGEHARVVDAFARPTLKLLDGKWSAFRVAVLRSAFSRDRRSVPADRLHVQVETFLNELKREGIEVPPGANGRGLCNAWVNDQWLFRDDDAEGRIVYSLTSAALEALDLVQNLSRDRVLVSESRLTTILETVRRWALEASPDAEGRIERLDTQIRELQVERDRLRNGGDVALASDDRMMDGFQHLIDLISQLPSDFKRVEESVLDMHRKMLRDFRDEDRPVTDVLDEYLHQQAQLVKNTPEGRAFDGAFVLLRSEALLVELRRNVGVLLQHPAAITLETREANDLRGAEGLIREGTKDVLAQRRRVTATLKDHIVNHDVLHERELDRVLRSLNREVGTWMESARPRDTIPVDLLPPAMGVTHLQERFHNPADAAPPPPLEDVEDDTSEPPTLEELRMQGGPSLDGLRDALITSIRSGDMDTVGRLFNELPPDLRRPVEILGLLHVVSRVDALRDGGEVEVFEAIRPNGDTRNFLVPTLSLTAEEATAIERLTDLDRGEPDND